MHRYFKLSGVSMRDFHMFCVEMSNGQLPDEDGTVKHAIRRLVLFCQGTYAEALDNHLEWVDGSHPVPEAELVKRSSANEWKSLFAKDDKGRPIAFRGLLGECLAFWVAKGLRKYPVVSLVKPGGNDPAFDLVALEEDTSGYLLRWIQAKATDENHKKNARIAAEKFGKLDKGQYRGQVTNALYTVAFQAEKQKVKLDHEALRSLQLKKDRQRYTIFVVHEPKLDGNILTTFKDHVEGGKERREAVFMRFKSVTKFLKEMEDAIRANIS